MARASIILLSLLALCSCEPDPGFENPRKFSYDVRTGICKSTLGLPGFNEIDFVRIRETKDCECIKFTKTEILLVLGDSVQIPWRFAYSRIKDYNFKGTVFDSAMLYFNYIIAADLRGADLSTLQYGYAGVSGLKDQFTKAPNTGLVDLSGDSLRCNN